MLKLGAPAAPEARERFLGLDQYRARREWSRYEGNALRDLFRQLRTRFLQRHRVRDGWAIDLGCGPGRFTTLIGGSPARTIQADLSREMLKEARSHHPEFPRVRADALAPPLSEEAFAEVVLLGNVVGHAGSKAPATLRGAAGLVARGGRLLVEIVPGAGERSRYLHRLPPEELRSGLRAGARGWRERIERGGFELAREAPMREHGFRRISTEELLLPLGPGWVVRETMAVAPGLGFEASRLDPIRPDPVAWPRLLALEEELGRNPARWSRAASILMALERAGPATRA